MPVLTCPTCGFESPAEMLFCGMCGTRLARACPACGFHNPPQFRFCGMCGAALEPLPAAVEVPSLAAPEPTFPLAPLLPPEAQAPLSPLEGERRLTTVVVADVRASTQLLVQVGTERWVEIMNHVLQLLEVEVYRLGGEVNQFRGDGLVAFFGASVVHEDDPERAVMAALQMQRVTKAYAAELAAQGLDLRLRIGVNTGEVILTSVGGRRYREDTAMGEAITLAARMEAAAEPGTVLVSENTYRLARPYFLWEELGTISVKGLPEPIAVYRPLALATQTEWAVKEELYRLTLPLIGRQREFKQLVRCVEDLQDGRGGIVLLTGEKGIGKSFLVAQVRSHLEREAMLRAEARQRDAQLPTPEDAGEFSLPVWLRGRCRSYDQSWPYSMWRDMLQHWLGMQQDEPLEALRDRLRERAQQLWGASYQETYPFLAALLALPLEAEFTDLLGRLDAESLKRQFFRAVRAWVTVLAHQGSLVLFFSDVQWVDSTSLELLQECLPLCDTLPVLWLVVFRPDRNSPVWNFQHYVSTEFPHRLTYLSLPPLSAEESLELLDWLIGAKTLPEQVSQMVLQRAEGNPYYLHELANALIAQGVLVRDSETGAWKLTCPITSLDLPESLQTLLLARLDRLPPDVRHVLQAAAVIGSVFWERVLQVLIPETETLRQHLTYLQREQLIQERQRVPEWGMEYAFISLLLREVAYESLLSPQRVTYHLRVAEALESLLETEGERPQRYGMVAYHYRQAGCLEKALDFSLKAAEQARRVYANAEALEQYTAALALLGELEAAATDEAARRALQRQRFQVLDQRRETFYLLGDIETGRNDARVMLELAQRLPDEPALMIDALLEQPGVGSIQEREELERGMGMAQQALELSRQLGDAHREMRALMALTNLYNLRSDPAWRWTGQQALELARRLGDRRAEVTILLQMGGAYGPDDLENSMACLQAALSIATDLHDKSAEIRLLSALGTQLARQGDYYRYLTEIEEKRLQLSREIGDRYAEGGALMNCGQIRGLWLGDYAAGLALEEEALGIWENITGRVYPLLRIAQLHTEMGNYDAALEVLMQAQPVGEREVRDMGRAGLGLVSAILFNAMGDAAHLRQALDSAGWVYRLAADSLVSQQYRMAALCEIAFAHLRLAELAAAPAEQQQHRREALDASGTAFDLYQGFGFVQIVECTSEEILFRHGLALQANGQTETGQDMVRRAYAEMRRKHALIPADSPFSQTYLEAIPLHGEIRAAYEALPAAGAASEAVSRE
ncbi:MAG TPA: AAA family ATPase [Anaerolineae bacterium]|nr:AAA family ATPase [Anaerolineae bacterium]HQM14404.1 AAA family ATPase [Anaerolineae bacterium]